MPAPNVSGATRARSEGPLKLAVPRGALFEPTLDVLDRAGIDTAALRSDSRSLVFDGGAVTIVTMRPSDVPTYVEAGAAEVGITGKDVLLEQSDRLVYELLDLGYGACRMVLAGREGDERLGESERRLGMMRIATKYPRVAERYFEQTGRQAEVIEVKGSVELAPLIGLADGIVDLVATRAHPGREPTRGSRGDRRQHGAPRRQPGRPQAARRRGRRADRPPARGDEPMRVRRFEWGRAEAVAAEIRAWAKESATEVDVEPIATRGDRGRRRGLAAARESASTELRRPSLRVEGAEIEAALGALDPSVREALELAAANIRAVAEAQIDDAPCKVELPQGQAVVLHEVAVGSAGVYAPGGRAAYPSSVLMCACRPASPASSGSRLPRRRPPMGGSTRSPSPPAPSAGSMRSTRWAAPRR